MTDKLFKEYKLDDNTENATTDSSDSIDIKIFIFPGILANLEEVVSLTDAVQKLYSSKHGRRATLYIYNEVFPADNNGSFNFSEHLQAITNAMSKIIGSSSEPYTSIGFSFGALLAAGSAKILAAQGKETITQLIDEPSFEMAIQYFLSNSDNFKRDLLNILNYAAKLSLGETYQSFLTLEDPRISELFDRYELEQLIEELAIIIANHYVDNAEFFSDDDMNRFNFYTQIAKRNLANIFLDKIKDDLPKLPNLDVVFTRGVAEKHGHDFNSNEAFTAGWENHTNNLTVLSPLLNQSHMSVVGEKSVDALAELLVSRLMTYPSLEPNMIFLSRLLGVATTGMSDPNIKPGVKAAALEALKMLSKTVAAQDKQKEPVEAAKAVKFTLFGGGQPKDALLNKSGQGMELPGLGK